MVTTAYFCDLCQSRYSTEQQAKNCEAKGITGPIITSGLILTSSSTHSKQEKSLLLDGFRLVLGNRI